MYWLWFHYTFFVNLHFAKFKFAKPIADGIECNPDPNHSKHYNRSVLLTHIKEVYDLVRRQVFRAYIILFQIYAFHWSKFFWKSNDINFIADQNYPSSLTGTEHFTVDDLSSFLVIHGFTISDPVLILPIFRKLLLRNGNISSKCLFWNEQT